MITDKRIIPFLDENGKINRLPRKHTVRLAVLSYLAEKFEPGMNYSEHQVNDICNEWHTFDDFFLLRRELVESGLMNRERDGSRYWRTNRSVANDVLPQSEEVQKNQPLNRMNDPV